MKAVLVSAAFIVLLAIACGGGEEAPPALTSTLTAASSPAPVSPSVAPEVEREPRLIFLRPEVDAPGRLLGVIYMSDDLAGSNVVQLTPGDVRASFVGLAQQDGTTTLYYAAAAELSNAFTWEARDLATGETTELTSIEPAQGDRTPDGSLSPDGRYVAWANDDGIDLLDLETDGRRRILTSNRGACEGGALGDCYGYLWPDWSPDGRLLLVRKVFWESGAAVIVDPFQEVPQEVRQSLPAGAMAAELAAWSPTSDAWCGYGHYEAPSGLWVSRQPEWRPSNLIPEYEIVGEPWRNVTDCVWLDEHRIAFVTATTHILDASQDSTTVSIYDLETAAATLVAELGSPVYPPRLFAIPGSNDLVYNDRAGGQPGLLKMAHGGHSPILEPGDVVLAVTPPIAWPEGIVAAEPEAQPCALLREGCEVQVTDVGTVQLHVREGAGMESVVKGKLSEGDIVCLAGGSVFDDGFRWWPVPSDVDLYDWVAQGDPREPDRPWLTATGRKCE
jgi:hypothetical protein